MKIAVINYSGNVGKSTIASQLLAPRLNAPIISVESINLDSKQDGVSVSQMRGRNFGRLQEQLMTMEAAIVDVGSSNVEEFIKLMGQYHGSHEEFDYFLVPVVNDNKQQGDTANMIQTLASLGVPGSKILLVMNKVAVDDDVLADFEGLAGMAASTKAFVFNKDAVIYTNQLYNDIKGLGMTVANLINDQTDWRAKLREATSMDDREKASRMVSLKRLAITVNQNLDNVYSALFGRKAKVKAAA